MDIRNNNKALSEMEITSDLRVREIIIIIVKIIKIMIIMTGMITFKQL